MKNLMINEDFIKKVALMDGDETKQLLLWAYNYAVNDMEPTKEEFNKSHFSVCIAFQDYKRYMDVCAAKWNKKANAVKEIKEIKTTSEL
jgi:hypothetical protein